MKRFLKISIPIVLAISLVSGLYFSRIANAIPVPAPNQTTVTATGFSSYSQIKIEICGVPVSCTQCLECNWDQFVSPSSTVYFQTGEQYIDYRGTAYNEGSISVWYYDYGEETWQIIGVADFSECTLYATNGFFTNIVVDTDDLDWELPIEE